MRYISLAVLVIAAGCSSKEKKIDYFGQTPPTLDSAVLFAPGIISTDNYEHSSPAFSPDGSVVLWTVMSRQYQGSMMEMTFENGQWSKPRRPTFADSTSDDFYPSFSPDGKKLLFSSRRKVPEGYIQGKDIRIWTVERTENGWGKPMPLDSVVSKSGDYAQSIAANGNIYFSSSVGGGTSFDIRVASRGSKQYSEPMSLPFNINSVGYEDGPYIAPDESFIIFESSRPGGADDFIDLYISYRNNDGDWSIPVNMGPKINSVAAERFAKLSPDGKYLFFGSNRNMTDQHWGFDVYWIDAKIIDELRPAEPDFHTIDWEFGTNTLEALHNLDTTPVKRIYIGQWTQEYPKDIDAVIINSSILRKEKKFDEADKFMNSKRMWIDNSAYRLEYALVKYALGDNVSGDSLVSSAIAKSKQTYSNYKHLADQLREMKLVDKSNYYSEKLK